MYDGDCGICDASVRLLTRVGCRATMTTSREWVVHHPEDAERCENAVLLARPDGTSLEAERAVAQALRLSPLPLPWVGSLLDAPGVRVVSGYLYRLVARHRTRISSLLGLRSCALPATQP